MILECIFNPLSQTRIKSDPSIGECGEVMDRYRAAGNKIDILSFVPIISLSHGC